MKALLEFLANELKHKAPSEFVSTLIDTEGKLKEGYQANLKPLFDGLKTDKYNEGKSDGKTEGKGWAEKESKSQWEKDFAEALGVEAAPIKDMAKAYSDKITAGAKTKELTENDILNHDSHLKIVNKLKEDLKLATDELTEGKLNSERSSKVTKLTDLLAPLKEKYSITDKAFNKEIAAYVGANSFKDDNGNLIPTDKAGLPLRSSDNSEILKIADHFNNSHLTDYYLPVAHKVETPGDKGPDGKDKIVDLNTSGYKTPADWSKAINSETDLIKKTALAEASRVWEQSAKE